MCVVFILKKDKALFINDFHGKFEFSDPYPPFDPKIFKHKIYSCMGLSTSPKILHHLLTNPNIQTKECLFPLLYQFSLLCVRCVFLLFQKVGCFLFLSFYDNFFFLCVLRKKGNPQFFFGFRRVHRKKKFCVCG